MRPRNRVSNAGVDLVKRFEGYRRQAAQLPDGRWTIGYGHTLTARAGAEVTESDADALLRYDLHSAGKTLDELVFVPLNQNQFDALCSFAFNLGVDEFRSSDVLKRLNEGAMVQAACAMELWRKAEFEGEEIVVDALVRRRAAEKILFLTPPDDAFVPAPTPVLRPRVDPGADALVPADTPTQLAASLYGTSVTVSRQTTPAPPPPETPPAPPPPLAAPAPEPVAEAPPAIEPELVPPSPEPPASRVTAAAEAVSARLETLFADAPEREAVEPDAPQPEALEPDAFEPEALEPETAEPFGLDPFEPGSLEPDDIGRDADEEAFIEAFIETPDDPEPEIEAEVEPEPEPAAPQTITPIVMSYPVAPPMSSAGPAFQPSFTTRPSPSVPPAPDLSPPDLEPEPTAFEPEGEIEAEPVVAEPLDEAPASTLETTDTDLWGDDEAFLEPPAGAPAVAPDEPEELELPPAAEVPPAPPPEEAYGLDEFARPPQAEPAAPVDTEPRERAPFTVENNAVRDFLPQRPQRQERPREPGLLTDLFLALLGVAFFGFAVFWALNAKVDPGGPGVHPSLIAWPTGFIGIGFVVVAIFRLLERLGDAAERD